MHQLRDARRGDPLPSVREMSALQAVPVATLQHALAVLADEGLVLIRQGRTPIVAGDTSSDRRSVPGLRVAAITTAGTLDASRTCASR